MTAVQLIAQDILAGSYATLPKTNASLYDLTEWERAAECTIEGDDYDLRYMMEREMRADLFADYCRRGPESREYDDPAMFDAAAKREVERHLEKMGEMV